MKAYRIFFEFYPFSVGAKKPESTDVEAETLEKAIESVKKVFGTKIEIFKFLCKEIPEVVNVYKYEEPIWHRILHDDPSLK